MTKTLPAPAAIGQTVTFCDFYGYVHLATVVSYAVESCCPYKLSWADRWGRLQTGYAGCDQILPL